MKIQKMKCFVNVLPGIELMQWRQDKGLTQTELADKMMTSKSTIVRHESEMIITDQAFLSELQRLEANHEDS